MIYSYEECIRAFGSDYQLKKQITEGKIYKIQKGIYSDVKYPSEVAVISNKYPSAIFTLDSAFYYYSMTDVIPDMYSLATDRNAAKIRDNRVIQYFVPIKLLGIGKTELNYNGVRLITYDKERLLIELIRNRNRWPFDYYKELIGYYRTHLEELDIEKLQEYLEVFPKGEKIYEKIQLEVF